MSGIAVPTSYTATTGNFLTAALWNAQVRDPVSFLLDPPRFSGLYTKGPTDPAVNSGTGFNAFPLDTEIYDTEGGHSPTVNPTRYTAVYAGLYELAYSFSWGGNATGSRAVCVRVNGATITAPGNTIQAAAANSNSWVDNGVCRTFLNVGDYVELMSWQNSGSGLNPSSTNCGLTVTWVAKS
jgi:hypothetical protein